ncbi:MAG: hypothetical protein SGI84_02930 [Gemmatimonadota bacterium]|nr:hypothetical protein [Gemmatimonadota bacterium]
MPPDRIHRGLSRAPRGNALGNLMKVVLPSGTDSIEYLIDGQTKPRNVPRATRGDGAGTDGWGAS